MLEKYASATKMQPQSSGSLRSNAGIEKGKEIAARLNIHRIHSQLRGLDSTGQSSGHTHTQKHKHMASCFRRSLTSCLTRSRFCILEKVSLRGVFFLFLFFFLSAYLSHRPKPNILDLSTFWFPQLVNSQHCLCSSNAPSAFLADSVKLSILALSAPKLLADIGTCAITAIPFEKSKVLFGLEELEEFSMVDETDAHAAGGDLGRSTAPLEKWGWIMFECGIENLTVKGDSSKISPKRVKFSIFVDLKLKKREKHRFAV